MREITGYTRRGYKINTEITKEPQFWIKYRTMEDIGCIM
jgi:hypothetical protein